MTIIGRNSGTNPVNVIFRVGWNGADESRKFTNSQSWCVRVADCKPRSPCCKVPQDAGNVERMN